MELARVFQEDFDKFGTFLEFTNDIDYSINKKNLSRVFMKYDLLLHDQDYFLGKKKMFISLKNSDIRFLNGGVNLFVSLGNIKEKRQIRLKIKSVIVKLKTGMKIIITPDKKFNLWDFYGNIPKKKTPYPPLEEKKEKTNFVYEKLEGHENFFEFDKKNLVLEINDIINNKEDISRLEEFKESDIQQINIELKEVLLEIIFSLMKITYEFFNLDELNVQALVLEFFKKYIKPIQCKIKY